MKIAYILTAIDHLGPFIVAKDTIDVLVGEVDKINVFYFKAPKNPLEFNVETRKINFFSPFDFSGFDVVHSHGFMADIFASHNVKKQTKWISTLHQKIYPNYSFSHNRIVAYFLEHFWLARLRKANTVVALTKDMRNYYMPTLSNTTVRYVYNGIPEHHTTALIPNAEMSQINELKKNTKLLVMCARLVYLKGIDHVIEMLSMSTEYSLLLIGDGEEKVKLKEQATQLKVQDRVLFVGYKNNPQDYLKLCDVYVMASRTEGFGLCVIEAAAQKLPVICNDLPVFREIFDDEVVRFNLENKESMLSALSLILSDHEKFSKKIYQKYQQNYTSKVMAKNYMELYASGL